MAETNESRVIRLVQLLLQGEGQGAITPAVISEKIDSALTLSPQWAASLDRQIVVDELIRRHSVWIGDDIALHDPSGHTPWLHAERKKGWRYWQRYREMTEQSLSWDAADKLDKSTDKILGMLQDPTSGGAWSRRGLVVGHVQSGKTSSYTGLICKAADAQYKVIIVLAGLHNNLRSQTQIRLEQGFLGYQTSTDTDVLRRVGVGLIDTDMSIKPNCATTRAERGDFGRRAATQLSISPEQRPWLFVVKKNKSVLVQLLRWIQNHVADQPIPDADGSGSGDLDNLPQVLRRVSEFPLLIIDDESDNASVDTGETVIGENGEPDDEHQPTTINKLIRRILHSFTRSAYVGYTATPFANIFIHERGQTRKEGLDLFPSAFIQNLAAPSNYVGPSRVFGRPTKDGREGQLPLVRTVSDFQSADAASGWMPVRHKIWHSPQWSSDEALPPSLRLAVDSFVLACAARFFRGQGKHHSSMLIHVTRFNQVQGAVRDDVERYVGEMRQRLSRRIGSEEILARLRAIWTEDFLPVTDEVRLSGLVDAATVTPSWQQLEAVIMDVVGDIEVRMINGTAKDVLDYEESTERGLKVIAIGGDKLARGLTLEGLCVSYFLRATRMYDTLMQMGRWFGYRPGYLDLCRLFTSSDLIGWFQHVSDAAAELREEFDLMASTGATPRDFGLKVQSHPELMVTSQLKMRSARTLRLSYSGQLMQTVSLPVDQVGLDRNLGATRRLVATMGAPSESGEILRKFGKHAHKTTGHMWAGVPASAIVHFLREYNTTSAAHRVNSQVLAEFIEKMADVGELTCWSVALVGSASGVSVELGPNVLLNMVKRSADTEFRDRYAIGVLLDPKDEWLAADGSQWDEALRITQAAWENKKERSPVPPDTPSGPALRKVRGEGANGVQPRPEQALLVVYVLDPERSGLASLKDKPPVVAFGISFPGSKRDMRVEYKVNNVGWEQEYGASE